MNKTLKIFESKKIRTVWNEEEEEWYFSVVDVVGALSDSTNPTDYLKKLRKRDSLLGDYIGTNCPQIGMINDFSHLRDFLKGIKKSIEKYFIFVKK